MKKVSMLNVLSFNGELTPIAKAQYQIARDVLLNKDATETSITINKAQVAYVMETTKEALKEVRRNTKARPTKEDLRLLMQDPEAFLKCGPNNHPMLAQLECRPFFITHPSQFMTLVDEAKEAGVDVFSEKALTEWILRAKEKDALVINDFAATMMYFAQQPYGIRVTKPRGVVIRLNQEGKLNKVVSALTAYESLLDQCLERALEEDAGKTTKKQYSVGQIHIEELDEHLSKENKCFYTAKQMLTIKNSSSLMLEMADAKGYKIVTLDMKIDVKDGDDEGEARRLRLVNNVVFNGFYLPKDGNTEELELYLPLLQTASQSRMGKIYMINLPSHQAVEEFRHELSYGAFREKYQAGAEVVLATDEARFGLPGTSSTKIGHIEKDKYNWKQIEEGTLEDCIKKVNYTVYKCEYVYNDKGEVIDYQLVKDVVTENNATDGTSLGSPVWFAMVNESLGYISKHELMYFADRFSSLDELKESKDGKLKAIFKKMIKLVQIRWGNCKGLVLMADLDQYEKTKGLYLYLTDGMVKAVNKEDAEMRVANVNNKKWGKQRLSQQFMTSLNLTTEEVKEMLDEQLSYLTNKVLVDVNEARKFVGAIANCEDLVDTDGETVDENGSASLMMATKLAVALSKNERVIKEKWIQNKLIDLMKDEITRLKYGKLAVNGIYAYCVPDPRSILDPEHALKAGEYYLNGYIGEMALLRAPQIHHSEAHVCNFVNDDYLWYLNDVLVFNPWDNTAQASQGADFDGDQFLVTNDKRVIAAIKRHGRKDYFILQQVPGADNKIKVPYSTQERLKLYVTRSVRDGVGKLSNYALIFSDMRNHWLALAEETTDAKLIATYKAEAKALNKKIAVLACLIGAEIDYAKTGVRGVLLDSLIPKDMPHFFLHYKGEVKKSFSYPQGIEKEVKRVARKGGRVYTSKSALGFCFDYVSNFHLELQKRVLQPEGSQSLYPIVCEAVTEAQLEAVRQDVHDLLRGYGIAMSDLQRRVNAGLVVPEEAKEARNAIFEMYQDMFNAVSEDKRAVAAECYIVTHADNAKYSKSAPWIFCFDGLMSLISNDKANILVRLPKFTSADSKVEIYKGTMFIDDVAYKPCGANDGIYQPISIMGDLYIDAQTSTRLEISRSKATEERVINQESQVTLLGFKHYKDKKGVEFNVERVIKALMKGYDIEIVFANGQYNALIAGQVVGIAKAAVGKEGVVSKRLSGKVLKVTGVKGQKRPLELSDARGAKGQLLQSLTLLVVPTGEATSVVPETTLTVPVKTDVKSDNYFDAILPADSYLPADVADYENYIPVEPDFYPEPEADYIPVSELY